jgi:uncharacterized membrane protein
MINEQWLSVGLTPFTVLFGIISVIACGTLSWLAITRSGFRRSTVGLEVLRFVIVLMVAIALNQPEWVQNFIPPETPTVAILWDESGSMETEDVLGSTESSGAKNQSRRQAIESLVQRESWSALAEKFDIDITPFSSNAADPKRGTDVNAALAKTLERHRNLRAVVLISDGSWNTGLSPSESATLYRMQNVPIFTLGVGSEVPLPDLEVTSLDAPTFGIIGKPTRIPFSVTSTLPRVQEVQVELTSSDGDQLTHRFEVPANGILQDAFIWNPKNVGDYVLTLTVPQSEDEAIGVNNSLSAPITIRSESLKVLVVESYPRWEYRFIRNALARDPGVDVSCLLFHPDLEARGGGKDYIAEFPQNLDELTQYDVIFLGDVGVTADQLTTEDCRRIKGLVESQATGLILMPGFRGFQLSLLETELSDLFPVVMDASQRRGWGNVIPAQIQLTEAGSESLLTKLADSPEANRSVWRSLPGFQWYAAVLRAKVGSQVLAVHATESNDSGRIPLLVTKTYGAGKILFMGTDGAWRWREGVEDKYHYRFWGQVARWMAYQRNMAGGESMRLFYSPDRPKTGQTLALNANVMGLDGEPLQSGNVAVQIIAPSGNSQLVRLAPETAAETWGLFTGYFVPEERGEHRAVLTCQESGASLETMISVQGLERERLGQPANFESLREVAEISRGRAIALDQQDQLITMINDVPEPQPQLKRIRLWAHPIFAAVFLLLVTVFWVGRKLAGVI